MLRVALVGERDQGIDCVVTPFELDDDQHAAVPSGPAARAFVPETPVPSGSEPPGPSH